MMRTAIAGALAALLVSAAAAAGEPASSEPSMRAATERWCAAIAAKDSEALARLYADEVGLYGTTMTREAVVEDKKAFFAKNPSFTQSIEGPIKIEKNEGYAGWTARFTKLVTVDGKKQSFAAYLVLGEFDREDKSGKDVRVVVESDTVTDANLLKQKRGFDPARFKTCEDALMGVYKSSAKIRSGILATSILDIESRPADGTYVLHVYEVPPMDGMTMTAGWYSFNTKTKILQDEMLFEAMTYDKKLLPHIHRLCR